MLGSRTCASLLACLLLALLAAAPAASAKPGYFVFSGGKSIGFSLKGSNGYWIEIGKEGGEVRLLASKEESAVTYSVRSLAPRGNEIRARFPGLGRIAVRFRPLRPPRTIEPHPFPGCKGGETVKQPGHFVGTIRFRGERGYTSVRATRVRAAIETTAKEVCKRSDNGPEREEDRTELFAVSESGREGVGFSADTTVIPEVTSTTSFSATTVELRRGMSIYRNTFALGKESDILPGDTRPFPLSATITPPPPFQGSAEFQRTAEGESTWTGSLTVPLPGLGRVALTGPDFTARLCQDAGCTEGLIDGHRLLLSLPTPLR